jgi:hypothetical protein
MSPLKLGMAILSAASVVLLAGSPARAANADIVGLWAGGVVWGQYAQDRTADKGTVNPLTGKLDLNPTNFGVGNTYERTLYSGRYAANPGLAFAIAEQDPGINQRQNENVPLYKPEYWPLVKLYGYISFSDPTGNYLDPVWKNLPPGMPQLGAPAAIVPGAFPDELYFIQANRNSWRYVPTDCRKHDDSYLNAAVSFNGQAVGCWEGNTLVVTSKGFTDQTFLRGFSGQIHSIDMVVEERFQVSADKNTIAYTRIVHDPMFLQPWNMGTQNLTRNANSKAYLVEDLPFDNRHLLEVGGGG